MSLDGILIPTPSQSAIYKSTFREAAKFKAEMIDGKRIENCEYQVVVLKNKRTEVKLDALCLKDGKNKTIATGIVKVLDEYNL